MVVEVTLNETPPSKGSHTGFFRKGRVVITDVQGKKLKSFSARMKTELQKQKPCEWKTDSAYGVFVIVKYAPPKSYFGKNGEPTSKYRPFKTTKPDIDKMLRAVLDCGTGVFWDDDAQVVYSAGWKQWGNTNQTIVYIGEADSVELKKVSGGGSGLCLQMG